MHKYKLVSKKGEGTFSEVIKAQIIKTGKHVAIKRMKAHFDNIEQVNNLREIQALKRLSPHSNIIKLVEVLYDKPSGRLALVFEIMDMNIYELIRGRKTYLPENKVRNYMWQMLKSIDHMHRNGIFHRDIKPENVLINTAEDEVKLADFGSCRGMKSKQPYTEYISTRWYRAPECLLTDGYYNYKMDLWGIGCVMFEIISLFPLFPGANELDQIQKIHNVVGSPSPELLAKMRRHSSHMNFNFSQKTGTGIEKLIPHASTEAIDLVKKLLTYNPEERYSARQALKHAYFREYHEKLPKETKDGMEASGAIGTQEDYADDDKPTLLETVSDEPEIVKTETKKFLEDLTKDKEKQGDNVSHSLTELHSQLFNSKDTKPHFPKIGNGKQEVTEKGDQALFPPITKTSKSVTNSLTTLGNTQKAALGGTKPSNSIVGGAHQQSSTINPNKSGRLSKMDPL